MHKIGETKLSFFVYPITLLSHTRDPPETMGESGDLKSEYGLIGSPQQGLLMATLAFFAGLTTIVFYGVGGPTFRQTLGISGTLLGLLLSAPHYHTILNGTKMTAFYTVSL